MFRFHAGVLKVIDLRQQRKAKGHKQGKQKKGGGSGSGGGSQPAATGAQALRSLLQPAAADVGVGAGLPAWD